MKCTIHEQEKKRQSVNLWRTHWNNTGGCSPDEGSTHSEFRSLWTGSTLSGSDLHILNLIIYKIARKWKC